MNLSSMNKDETLNLPQDDGYIAFQRTITEALKSNADCKLIFMASRPI